MTALERTTFESARTAEYFHARELQTMTGQPAERFPDVLLKELLDNAMDAAEAATVAPVVKVVARVRGDLLHLAVQDNGGGIPADTVRRVLNFQTLTSDKAAYRSPTRGAQGNALKTVVGIPYALGCREPVVIEAGGLRHEIRPRVDPTGEVRVDVSAHESGVKQGTRVRLALPLKACRAFRPTRWAASFALFNPHASVQIRRAGFPCYHAQTPPPRSGNLYRPTVAFPGAVWRKFLPTDLTSPWWYDEKSLTKLVFGHIAVARKGDRDLPLRDFVRQFRGLSRTDKAKRVCDQFPGIARLSNLEGNAGVLPELLGAMRAEMQPPSPGVLGLVGEDHLRQRFHRWFGVKRWWYKKVADQVDGIPFVFEVALATTERPGAFCHGVNFSPTFADPFAGTRLECPEVTAFGAGGFLQAGHVDPAGVGIVPHTAAAVHLVCPALEFLDKGKTTLRVPPLLAKAVAGALWAVVKDLYREEERRKKDAARQGRADRARERERERGNARRWTLKAAVFEVMPEAVRHATGGLSPVSVHTLFYSIRRLVQQLTDEELTSKYCEQDLIPAYQQERGPILLPDGRPALYYEARGTLYEPHTGVVVPLGTREVEAYRFPAWLYDKILFIEKQGLWPVLQAARLAERYDMAIVAGEGYASEACRVLFANAEKGRDYQLFVGHDADPHGYNIGRTLREATRRMPGHRVDVIDVGLRLEDALGMGLQDEEFTRNKALPQGLELTDKERQYFEGRRVGPKSWVCRRVELNAFTGPGLVGWLEAGLRAAGVRGKVVPPDSALPALVGGLYRGTVGEVVDGALERLLDVDGLKASLADAFEQQLHLGLAREWVERALAKNPAVSWQQAISAEVRQGLGRVRGDLEGAILDHLRARRGGPDRG